jgi:SAM-dependent methyltransferase
MSEFDEAYDDDHSVFGDPYPDLLGYFADRRPGRLLDLGCGQGRNAVPLAALGYDVTAVDGSAVGVAQTVRAAGERGLTVRGVAGDLRTFPIRGVYDVVLVDMVLHALTDSARRRVLADLRPAVEPGGTAYVVVPDPGPLVDEVIAALSPWPTAVREVQHRLTSGEHRGEYTFTAVIGERPPS